MFYQLVFSFIHFLIYLFPLIVTKKKERERKTMTVEHKFLFLEEQRNQISGMLLCKLVSVFV